MSDKKTKKYTFYVDDIAAADIQTECEYDTQVEARAAAIECSWDSYCSANDGEDDPAPRTYKIDIMSYTDIDSLHEHWVIECEEDVTHSFDPLEPVYACNRIVGYW